MNVELGRTINWLLKNGISEDEINTVFLESNPARDQVAMVILPALAANCMEDVIDDAIDQLFNATHSTTRNGIPGIKGKIINVLRDGNVPRLEIMEFVSGRDRQRLMLAASIFAGLLSKPPEGAWQKNGLMDLARDACTKAEAILDHRIAIKTTQNNQPTAVKLKP